MEEQFMEYTRDCFIEQGVTANQVQATLHLAMYNWFIIRDLGSNDNFKPVFCIGLFSVGHWKYAKDNRRAIFLQHGRTCKNPY